MTDQKARAESISAEIGALDQRLAQVVNRFAAATQRLQSVEGAIKRNTELLKVAEWQTEVAQNTLTERAVAMYKEADVNVVEAILGSASLNEIIDKVALFARLGAYDREVVDDVEALRTEVLQRRAELLKSREEVRRLLAQQALERQRIQSGLEQRKRRLAALRGEIKNLQKQLRRPVVRPVTTESSHGLPPASETGARPDSGTAAPGKPNAWWPLIKQAADANGISAAGLYRLMMVESGGNAAIVGGAGHKFCGLFQYWPPLWKGSWNPWRGRSIFDGAAQIKATALAIRLGHGPQWWAPSYQWAFGTF